MEKPTAQMAPSGLVGAVWGRFSTCHSCGQVENLPHDGQYCSARHLGRDVIAFIAETCVNSFALVSRSADCDESRRKALSNQRLDHCSSIVPNTIGRLLKKGSNLT